MIDYLDDLKKTISTSVVVTATVSRGHNQDGTTTEYDSVSCECGPHSLSFPAANLVEDAARIADWWESTARFPLIFAN
jgi:hypothetical protein